ncbi:hypothetical protein ACIPR7_20425, partial [Pectobacterium parvum]
VSFAGVNISKTGNYTILITVSEGMHYITTLAHGFLPFLLSLTILNVILRLFYCSFLSEND